MILLIPKWHPLSSKSKSILHLANTPVNHANQLNQHAQNKLKWKQATELKDKNNMKHEQAWVHTMYVV